jgi:hypothetical protein
MAWAADKTVSTDFPRIIAAGLMVDPWDHVRRLVISDDCAEAAQSISSPLCPSRADSPPQAQNVRYGPEAVIRFQPRCGSFDPFVSLCARR